MGIEHGGAHKYAVRISGTGCHVKVGTSAQSSGFYATRFVEARDEEEAIALAIELVRRDLQGYGSVSPQECTLSPDEIWKDPVAFDRYAPGTGFTWY